MCRKVLPNYFTDRNSSVRYVELIQQVFISVKRGKKKSDLNNLFFNLDQCSAHRGPIQPHGIARKRLTGDLNALLAIKEKIS